MDHPGIVVVSATLTQEVVGSNTIILLLFKKNYCCRISENSNEVGLYERTDLIGLYMERDPHNTVHFNVFYDQIKNWRSLFC